jgi:hypothetical protein
MAGPLGSCYEIEMTILSDILLNENLFHVTWLQKSVLVVENSATSYPGYSQLEFLPKEESGSHARGNQYGGAADSFRPLCFLPFSFLLCKLLFNQL